ncbi:substrate-binding domain-containing protein [Methanoregula sp.]|uniref:substrate-binding domain-containing protein n=1 Tax=Methanoregula sp. TaxID=2052170 RepID=UPI002CD852CF|nr:substrate-binding domain-containing protein [Methanoregula sp.]HVP97027.1 substrate-binding domain-containing protein [Methanoregula sp.]
MYANKKRMNNEMAVSPIVATLVLIVVAVIGAVAVGTIMGTFSTDVSKQASAGQAASASSTNVLLAGSTTIQPAMNLVAADYMAANPGVKITVQGGGSGAGLQSVSSGIADIGMFSQAMDTAQLAAYPTVKQYVVGYGGVVAIYNNGTTPSTYVANVSDLKGFYTTGATYHAQNGMNGLVPTEIVTRSDVSGTADSFGSYIGLASGAIYTTTTNNAVAKNGNGDMNTEVKGHVGALGFTDLDYALTATGYIYLPWDNIGGGKTGSVTTTYTYKDVRDAKNGIASTFPVGAVRPLELLTNGQPSALENSIIQFTTSPSEAGQFHSINLVHASDVVTL